MCPSSADRLSLLLAEAARSGADAADAVMFEVTDVNVGLRHAALERLERSESAALGIRVFVGKQQSMASTTDLSKTALHTLAERAVAMAKTATEDPYAAFADPSLLAKNWPDLDLYDDKEPASDTLLQQCSEAEETALSVPGITNSEGADAHYTRSRVTLGIQSGRTPRFMGSYGVSSTALSVSVLAGEGTAMERDYAFTSARHTGDLMGPATIGREAADRALRRLHPRKVESCEVPVMFEPRVARSLLSAFAGAISGAAIARGTSFLKDSMGEAVFAPHITIIEDPLKKRGLGSRPFDGEGVAGIKRTVVDRGMLTTWLLDVRSANKLGLTTTGHASRGIASPPSPSSTNLYMQPGTASPEELMRGMAQGFYVTELFGMGVNLITGDYSQGASGLWIENGTLGEPVSEVTIAGNLRDMFRAITPANDLVFRYATNAPTLCINAMTVAGR